MTRFYNQLSGRLKLVVSVVEGKFVSTIQPQRSVYRYACKTPVLLKNNLDFSLISCPCQERTSALFQAYQRNVRWNSSQSKPTEVSYEDLLDLLDDGGIIIDVRTEKEATGLIPQARNIPLENLKEALSRDAEDFEQVYGIRKPSKKEEKLVFYAAGPVKSSTALELAQKLGFKKARHYPGGWTEWSEKQILGTMRTTERKT